VFPIDIDLANLKELTMAPRFTPYGFTALLLQQVLVYLTAELYLLQAVEAAISQFPPINYQQHTSPRKATG
jgi:hypothetical protein